MKTEPGAVNTMADLRNELYGILLQESEIKAKWQRIIRADLAPLEERRLQVIAAMQGLVP